MNLAGIDIGTNTLRMLIADAGRTEMREIRSERQITRLGQDLDLTGRLSREAAERSLTVLRGFAEAIHLHAVLHLRAVGTSALRNAANASEFISEVKRKTGIDIEIVTGEEEARLTLLGVVKALETFGGRDGIRRGPMLVIDVGGGSTEIIAKRSDDEVSVHSLPLGAVYLSERFVRHDPSSDDEIQSMREIIRAEMDRRSLMPLGPGVVLIGTAGTVTTMAAIDQKMTRYDPGKINGSVLTHEAVDAMVSMLSFSSLAERKTMPGLEPGREDIILAGSLVVQEIMKRFSAPVMFISDWGLREGILFDLADKVVNHAGGKGVRT